MPNQKKSGKPKPSPSDLGTPELWRQREIRVEPIGPQLGGAVRGRVVDGCELDRLLGAKSISTEQHEAGIRAERDFSRAAGGSNALAALVGGGPTQKGMPGARFLFAVRKISEATAHVIHETGREPTRILVSVVTDTSRIQTPRQLAALRLALDALCDFYRGQFRPPPTSLRR
jgi:hypothetical protein